MKTNKSYSAVKSAIRTHAKDIVSRFGIKRSQAKKCVEKLVEAFGPLDVGDPATLGDAFYRFPLSLVNDAFESLDPAAAFQLIEQSDLRQLADRIQTVEYLLQEATPLCARADLLEYASRFRAFLLKNRDCLIRTGLPPQPFAPSRWLYLQLGRLYDTRTTSAPWPASELFGHARDADRPQRPPYRWVRYEASTTPWLPIRGPEQVLECPYEEASYLKGLEERDAERIERDRPRLWQMKERVLAALEAGMAVRDVEQPWKDCLAALTGNLTADDLEFYLRMDRYYLGVDFTEGDESSAHPVMIPGGLTNLLEVIGHYEQEKRIGMLHTTLEKMPSEFCDEHASPSAGGRSAHWAYFKLFERHADMDVAVDHLNSLRGPVNRFWLEFRSRVRAAFEQQFKVPIVLLISPQLKGLLPPQIRGVEAHVEEYLAQGNWPDAPPGRRYKFFRQGDSWTVQFGGNQFAERDLVGLFYISHLLQHPGRRFSAEDLRSAHYLFAAPERREGASATPRTQEGGAPEERSVNETRGKSRTSDDAIDRETHRSCRRHLMRLEQQIAEAERNGEAAEAERLRTEYNKIQKYLDGATYRGTPKHLANARKKDRDAVNNAIHRALDRLGQSQKDLERHLRLRCHIEAGYWYDPDPQIQWQT